MRKLMSDTESIRRDLVDGVKIHFDDDPTRSPCCSSLTKSGRSSI